MKLSFKSPFGIRFKLVFLSSFLLVIPWLGYKYILEMEGYLNRGQEEIVLGTAQALATALNERPELFDEGSYSPARRTEDLYVYPIFSPIGLVDGSLIDWGPYQQYEVDYGADDQIITGLNPLPPPEPVSRDTPVIPFRYQGTSSEGSGYDEGIPIDQFIPRELFALTLPEPEPEPEPESITLGSNSLSFKSMVGEHNGALYAYFKVVDDNIVYRSRDALSVNRSDFLQITVLSPDENGIARYIVAPYEPEFIFPYRVAEDFSVIAEDETNARRTRRISGQWYETGGGYEVELQIPMDMIGERLGFAFFDVDDPERRSVDSVVATFDAPDVAGLGSLRRPTPEIDRIVAGMGHNNSHIQVVDRSGRVLLTVGDIQSATGLRLTPSLIDEGANKYWRYVQESWRYVQDRFLNPIYYRILTRPSNDFSDGLYSGVTREGTHIDSALTGTAMTQFRTLADSDTRLLEAAHPIIAGGEVMGAVVVDQNMNGLRAFRNQSLEQLFNTMLAVMLVVAFGLFFFASRISSRIRVLRNQAEGIIDNTGRLQNTIVASRNSDEIGDLSRSFSSIVERLSQYTNYLENMSSRLSHELRTPVTVVRSSLENLSMTESKEDSAVYLERAEEGISRLNLILTNMSEATRLEQMLQTSEKEKIELNEVVHGCVEGYKLAYPDSSFETDLPKYPIHVLGVPEYIAQLLDKLIANAGEFSYPDQPITIYCRALRDHAVLKVSNAGPWLPEEMKDRLFDSMISVRPQEKQKQPHLGMGLHIARLIADFHGGSIRADNRSDREGVVITLVVPLSYR